MEEGSRLLVLCGRSAHHQMDGGDEPGQGEKRTPQERMPVAVVMRILRPAIGRDKPSAGLLRGTGVAGDKGFRNTAYEKVTPPGTARRGRRFRECHGCPIVTDGMLRQAKIGLKPITVEALRVLTTAAQIRPAHPPRKLRQS